MISLVLFFRKPGVTESIKELIAIMSNGRVEEAELSFEEIQICTPSTIQSQLCRTSVDILYNTMARANLMSASFAHTYFGDDILTLTNKSYKITPRTRLEGLGVLHNISLYHNKIEIPLDFHVFDI
jgi:hypothetical protein